MVARIEVTGASGGTITVDSHNLDIAGGSQLLAGITADSNLVDAQAGNILVNGTGNIYPRVTVV